MSGRLSRQAREAKARLMGGRITGKDVRKMTGAELQRAYDESSDDEQLQLLRAVFEDIRNIARRIANRMARRPTRRVLR